MTIGVNVRSEKSRSRISSTKKTPAIGALKTDAIPAAAPHPSSVAVFCGLVRKQLPAIGADHGADRDDRPLGPGRAAGADRQRRGDPLADRDSTHGSGACCRWIAYITS